MSEASPRSPTTPSPFISRKDIRGANARASSGSLKHAEASAARVLSLPMFPELTQEEVQAVIEGVVAWDKSSH